MTDWEQDGGFASWGEAVAHIHELEAENTMLREAGVRMGMYHGLDRDTAERRFAREMVVLEVEAPA